MLAVKGTTDGGERHGGRRLWTAGDEEEATKWVGCRGDAGDIAAWEEGVCRRKAKDGGNDCCETLWNGCRTLAGAEDECEDENVLDRRGISPLQWG